MLAAQLANFVKAIDKQIARSRRPRQLVPLSGDFEVKLTLATFQHETVVFVELAGSMKLVNLA